MKASPITKSLAACLLGLASHSALAAPADGPATASPQVTVGEAATSPASIKATNPAAHASTAANTQAAAAAQRDQDPTLNGSIRDIVPAAQDVAGKR